MPLTLLRPPFFASSAEKKQNGNSLKKVSSIEIILYALLAFVFFAIPWIYINNEQIIQFWDQPSYHNLALFKMLSLRETQLSLGGIKRQIMEVYDSTGDSYSQFHTLLISPLLLVFGTSRVVYITLLSLLYQLPFTLVLARIAALMVPAEQQKKAYWLTILIAVLTPALWLATLNGYPDAGAAFLIALATLLYLQNMQLTTWWRIGVISILLAVSIMFRRHFVYDVVVFFVVVSIHQLTLALATSASSPKEKLLRLTRSAFRVGVIGILLLVTVAIIGWPFIERLIYTNYRYFYTSYERSTQVNISYFLSYYGWVFILAALAGLIWSITSSAKTISRPIAAFAFLFGVLAVLQWVFTVRQIGFHYSTHFTPWIILGLFTVVWQVRARLHAARPLSYLLGAGAMALFAVNFTHALTWVKIGSTAADDAGWESLKSITLRPMAGKFAPPIQADYDKLISLTRYLHEIASPKDPIYVASSSALLNDDLLWHVNRFLYEPVEQMKASEFYESKTLNILHWIPFTDSGDSYPLDKLIESEIVITTTPVQLNLPAGEQQVLTVVVDAFTNNWLFAKDFTLLPKTFLLEGNTQVHIYKRIKPTSIPTAIITLQEIMAYMDRRPGAQLDWISYNPTGAKSYVQLEKDKTHTLILQIEKTDNPTWIFAESADGISKIKGEIEFSEPVETSYTVRAQKVSATGERLETLEKTCNSIDKAFELTFSSLEKNTFVVLDVLLPEFATETERGWIWVKSLSTTGHE